MNFPHPETKLVQEFFNNLFFSGLPKGFEEMLTRKRNTRVPGSFRWSVDNVLILFHGECSAT